MSKKFNHVCPCGVKFTSTNPRQIWHDVDCRNRNHVKAHRKRLKQELVRLRELEQKQKQEWQQP